MEATRAREATIDVAALAHNLAELRRLGGGREVIAVVKADGYGHGAVRVARALLGAGAAAGATRLAVVTVDEAAALREAGIDAPILLLGGLQAAGDEARAVALGLGVSIQRAGDAARLARAARGAPVSVEVEVDTGMARTGVAPEAAAPLLAELAATPELALEGVYTHLARADEEDLAASRAQLARFADVLAAARRLGALPPRVHVANSAGVLASRALADALPPEVNATRPGLALYGVRPAPHLGADLRPVMTVSARVVGLREVAAGDPVGYGATWRAPSPTRIATVAIGYADGVPWSADGAEMTLRGRRVPLVGRISMDLVTLDVGRDPVEIGDVATLFGAGGPPVEELAARAGTLPYEILVRVGRRVPRRAVSPV